jgi:hypothetical protein
VIGPAHRYYADRLVVVGDAAVTRLYKDGIGAASLTAAAAARTAVARGVAAADFAAGYLPVARRVVADNHYGRLCFALWNLTRRTPPLLRAWRRAIEQEQSQPPDQRLHMRVLWGMFTGDMSYRRIFWMSVSPRALGGFVRGLRPAGRR